MEKGLDALIMNNLHYSVQNGNIDSCENEIYELILSSDIDGLIFLAESFTDSYLTDSIISLLKKRNDIPIVVCSRKNIDFGMDNVFFLNDLYNNGTADAAEHLISVHNCRNIMLIAEPNPKYSIEKYIQNFIEKHSKSKLFPIKCNTALRLCSVALKRIRTCPHRKFRFRHL